MTYFVYSTSRSASHTDIYWNRMQIFILMRKMLLTCTASLWNQWIEQPVSRLVSSQSSANLDRFCVEKGQMHTKGLYCHHSPPGDGVEEGGGTVYREALYLGYTSWIQVRYNVHVNFLNATYVVRSLYNLLELKSFALFVYPWPNCRFGGKVYVELLTIQKYWSQSYGAQVYMTSNKGISGWDGYIR